MNEFPSCKEFFQRKICTVGTLWTKKPQLTKAGWEGGTEGLGKTEQRHTEAAGCERTEGAVLVASPGLHGASGWRMRPTSSFCCTDFL